MTLKNIGMINFFDFAKAKERFNKSTKQILDGYNIMGIYGIYLDDELVYIGQSINIKNRWIKHKENIEKPIIILDDREKGLDVLYNKLGDYYRANIESIYFCVLEKVNNKNKLKQLENKYIEYFKPKYNIRH